jgi:hypothetical protein
MVFYDYLTFIIISLRAIVALLMRGMLLFSRSAVQTGFALFFVFDFVCVTKDASLWSVHVCLPPEIVLSCEKCCNRLNNNNCSINTRHEQTPRYIPNDCMSLFKVQYIRSQWRRGRMSPRARSTGQSEGRSDNSQFIVGNVLCAAIAHLLSDLLVRRKGSRNGYRSKYRRTSSLLLGNF